jgi:hypothetical protein
MMCEPLFVRGLAPEQVYVHGTASCDHVPAAARDEYGAIVGGLMDDCVRLADAGSDAEYSEAWRLLHVVLAVLHRPFGAQVGPGRVMIERCRQLLRAGGLRDLWEAPVCPPRQQNRRLGVGADSAGDESPEETARNRNI